MEILNKFLLSVQHAVVIFEAAFPNTFPALYQIISCFFFALNFLMIKLLSSIPVSQLVMIRGLITFLINYAVIACIKINIYHTNEPQIQIKLIGRALFGGIGVQILFQATRLLPLSEGNVIFKTSPLWTTLFATVYLQVEKFSLTLLINVALCMLGIVFIAKPPMLIQSLNYLGFQFIQEEQEQEWAYHTLGVILCLIASFVVTTNQILVSSLSGSVSEFAIIAYLSVSWLIITYLAQIYFEDEPLIISSFMEVLGLFIIGLTGFLGQLFVNRSFFKGKLTQMSLVGQIQIVFSYIFDIFILNHEMDRLSVIGTLVLSLCLILEIKRDKKKTLVIEAIQVSEFIKQKQ